VLLLAGADKRLGLIDTLAAIIPDHRDPTQITHTLADILRARVFAIACGYPDADDPDDLRKDRPSNWPADGCRRAATTWPRNRPCPVGLERRRRSRPRICVPWSG